MEYLSNIELYYSPEPDSVSDPARKRSPNEDKSTGMFELGGDDYKHIVKVMRHKTGDKLYVTNGKGSIFLCTISSITDNKITLLQEEEFKYENKFSNIIFCIPKLKNPERFEFALEKCAEMGITNFIIFESARTVSKGTKLERWNKVLISAMKQSLRSFLPEIKSICTIREISSENSDKIVFDQNGQLVFGGYEFQSSQKYLLIFGPEGGLTEEELNLFNKKDIYKLADNRLRSETAIIKAASLF